MKLHLYFLCYRVEALVVSMLPPEEFGTYMAVGTNKLTRGKVLFFEVDPDFKSDFFDIESARAKCVPRSDGSPKRSVYVSIYRVLENIESSRLGKLYLVTRDGLVIGIEPTPCCPKAGEGPYLFQELCPVAPLIATTLPPADFVSFVTDRSRAVSVPRIFFADLASGEGGTVPASLPYRQPEHITDCFRQLGGEADKRVKTVDRAHADEFFFRTIRAGFFLGDANDTRFYPFPTKEDFAGPYHAWWRSATMG